MFARLRESLFPHVIDQDEQMRVARRFLILLSMATALAFQIWRGVFNNFAVEEAGVVANQMGLIQGLREVPGFLAVLVVYLLLLISERNLALLATGLMAVGVASVGFFPSVHGVLLTTVVMSLGFHVFETVNQSISLQHVPRDRLPLFLGQLRAWSGLAGLSGLALVMFFSSVLGYKGSFLLGGVVVAAATIWGVFAGGKINERVRQHRRMVLRRKYGLYYLLTFLSGARRQVFVAFAVFLLVERHGFSVREVSTLFFINSALVMLLAPAIGRLIQRVGERRVILLEYSGLILVFLGYTLATEKWQLVALYILDHFFFNMAMAIRTWFQKIAEPADMASSASVSMTINHIAAVVIPMVGGVLWMVDYRLTFYMGVALALCSLVAGFFVRTPEPELVEIRT